MKKKTTGGGKRSGSRGVELGVIGASLAGLAAAYFFLGPKGKKHRKQTKAWAIKMKGDVVEKLENVRTVSEPVYNKIVDSVATEYKKRKMAGNKEIDSLARDIRKHWKTMSTIARA
jgi:hypothetical protein